MEGFTKDEYELLQQGLDSIETAITLGTFSLFFDMFTKEKGKQIDNYTKEDTEELVIKLKNAVKTSTDMLINYRELPKKIDILKKKLETIKESFV